jgi:tetratricopeptide (TPR) repeat protein
LPLTVPAALLVVLAHHEGWLARERLALIFWPDATPADALHHLRINLHRTKQLLAGWGRADALATERSRVRLDLPSDLALLRRAQAEGDAAALAELNPGRWLAGWQLPAYGGFAQWCEDTGAACLAAWLAASRRGLPGAAGASGESGTWGGATTRAAAASADRTPAPPGGDAARPDDRTPIGRDAEMARLRVSPAPALLLLGEPGAGKTTLLLAAHPKAPVLRGLEGLHAMPYRPLLATLREHGRQLERCLREPAHPLRPYRLDLARVLPELAPDEALPPLDALTARTRLVEALTRAFEALTPVLLVDDLQWCDAATVEWLLTLAHGERLRWRAAARRHEVSAELQQQLDGLHKAARLETVAVPPLDRDAVARVCALKQPALAAQPERVERLHALSGGNPFMLGELLSAGGTEGAEAPAAPTLARLDQLVMNRLQGLSAPLRAAVEAAAVLVQAVPPQALREDAGDRTPAADWARDCQRAVAAGLLREAGPEGQLACRHDLVRQAVQRSLAPARRAALHRHAALWLAAQAEGGVAPDALTIAEHWRAAGEPQTALAWSHRGAEQLKARGNFTIARQLWRRVADESLDAAQSLSAQLELAACDLFEDLSRGEAALEAVQARLSAVADAERRRQIEGRLRSALVDNRVFAGDIARAQVHAERLRALLPALPVGERVDALEVLIELAMREPDIPAAWALLAQLRGLAPQRPSLLSWEGQIHWFGGQAQAAHDALAKLLERHPEYCSGMTIENDLAVMLHALGRAAEAEVMVRRSLQSWAGVAHAEAISLMVLGVVLLSAARFEEADEALGRALQLARDQASPGFEAEALVRRARVRLAWERPADAQAALAEAEALLGDSPEPLRVSQFVLAQVQAALALGRPWPQAGVARLHQVAQRSTHPLVHARLMRVALEQARAAGDVPAAAAQAAAMSVLARRNQLGEQLAEALWLQAELEPAHPLAGRWRSEARTLALRGGLQLMLRRLDVRPD